MNLDPYFKVDVQLGSGWLNYINGYVAKGSDSMDFKTKEHFRDEAANAPWRQTYRLLCKRAPMLTEVYISMKKRGKMIRTFQTDTLCPVIPGRVDIYADKATRHHRLYAAYLQRGVDNAATITFIPGGQNAKSIQEDAFIHYCRVFQWDSANKRAKARTYDNTEKEITAVGVKFEFELYDNFIGQFALTFFPHADQQDLLSPYDHGKFEGTKWIALEYTKHFVGVLSYLLRLTWYERDSRYLILDKDSDHLVLLKASAFPYRNFPERRYGDDLRLFATPSDACLYLLDL